MFFPFHRNGSAKNPVHQQQFSVTRFIPHFPTIGREHWRVLNGCPPIPHKIEGIRTRECSPSPGFAGVSRQGSSRMAATTYQYYLTLLPLWIRMKIQWMHWNAHYTAPETERRVHLPSDYICPDSNVVLLFVIMGRICVTKLVLFVQLEWCVSP